MTEEELRKEILDFIKQGRRRFWSIERIEAEFEKLLDEREKDERARKTGGPV